MSFTDLSRTIREGDLVIIWGGREYVVPIIAEKGGKLQNKRGMFLHDSFIGKPYGVKIVSTNGKGFMFALFPTPEIWTKALNHRTQILYTVDISIINLHLELRPGTVVVESGTGSGALSTSIARCISPNGKLYTFEFNENRAEAARKDFERNKINHLITVTWRDVCKEGFQLKGIADAVFLDLPSPWEVVESAKEALIEDGKLCSFSPCIEQVQRTCLALTDAGFVDLFTIECLLRPYDVRPAVLERLKLEDNEGQSHKRSREVFEADQPKEEKQPEIARPAEVENTGGELKEEKLKEVKMEEVKEETNQEKVEAKQQKVEGTKRGSRGKNINELKVEKVPVTCVRPFNDARGHTGFLTFARKRVTI